MPDREIADERQRTHGNAAAELRDIFWREYIDRATPLALVAFESEMRDGLVHCKADLLDNGQPRTVRGEGNGPIAAFVKALGIEGLEVASYPEHALASGAEATAIAYVQVRRGEGRSYWGAAVDTNIELAPVKALLSAVNRSA